MLIISGLTVLRLQKLPGRLFGAPVSSKIKTEQRMRLSVTRSPTMKIVQFQHSNLKKRHHER
jgi:hypothetical protein